MKKFGFTLAEVLITLGIIGVIAALTTPALVNNSGQKKLGPSLARFANMWDTASERLILDNGANRLSSLIDIDSVETSLPERLASTIIMTPIDNGDYNINGGNGTVDTMTNVYQLKEGSTLSVKQPNEDISYEARDSYLGPIAFVYYDIDGTRGKNQIGYDIFGFIVDNAGMLIPYGSSAHAFLANKDFSCNPNDESLESNLACTGAIANNNWEANY